MQSSFTGFVVNEVMYVGIGAAIISAPAVAAFLRDGDTFRAAVLAGAATTAAVAIVVISSVREAANRNDWPLAIRPLEDGRDTPSIYLAKAALFVLMYLAAIALPALAFCMLTNSSLPFMGSPQTTSSMPPMGSSWFPLAVVAGSLLGFAWLRWQWARRRQHAQTRKAGVLAE